MAKRKRRKLYKAFWCGPNQDILEFVGEKDGRTLEQKLDAIQWNMRLHLQPDMSRRPELVKWANRVKAGVDHYVAAWTYAAEHPQSKWRGHDRR